jgi:hypothetical protein
VSTPTEHRDAYRRGIKPFDVSPNPSPPKISPTRSILKSVKTIQSGKLKRKPSGGERAWFLEEESEPRNKEIFLAGENLRADVSVCLTVLRLLGK